MNFSARDRNPLQRYGGLGAVALVHIVAVYLLITGLAHRMMDAIKQPLETRIIEDIKPPPPPPDRPPPSPKLSAPPPPYIPAPEVPVTQTPDIVAIAAPATVPPKESPPQKQAESIAPPGPPAVPEQKGRAHADWEACMPLYPANSLAFEEEGTTRIHFEIGADSKLLEATLVRSSGHNRLDKAALKALSNCPFQPGMKDGKPIASSLTVDFVWSLSGGSWR